ncbi:ATP-binding cassette domain-containing protein [Streptomyces sp. JV176]|nr:ATP-binding cassette domain-containing protein [Streptomyces sp. JV176]
MYAELSVADHLRMGAALNPRWDAPLARRRIEQTGLAPKQKAGGLSGGQRAQLALTLAVAKRPELLIFDEPAAALAPLARREFLENLMEFVGDLGASAMLSSHALSDVERACDYLIVLAGSRIQVVGDVADPAGGAPPDRRVLGRPRDDARGDRGHPIRAREAREFSATRVLRTTRELRGAGELRGRPRHRPAAGPCALGRGEPRPGGTGPGVPDPGHPHRRRIRIDGSGDTPMTWLTWRQFRTQALVGLAALLAVAICAVVIGLRSRDRYEELRAQCTGGGCSKILSSLTDDFGLAYDFVGYLLIAVPGIIGLFWGAPLITRELEAGTHRLVWNQSMTRTTWLAAKLGLVTLAGMTVTGLYSLLLTWSAGKVDLVADHARHPAP